MKQRVFVGLSGGVDSSVAAALLLKQGFAVTGVHIKCFNVDGCAERDADDARRVAETLGIPFYVFNLEDAYKERVVAYVVEGYRRGITPNPDVICNREIKFGLFMRRALELGADFVATGHYVALKRKKGAYALYAAKDAEKDQSYFLWTLTQEHLKRCLFPLGTYKKPAVRKIAETLGLPTAHKKDSQGICFLGQVALADFLKGYIPARTGAIVTASGERIGAHEGAHAYTPGQRHGLHLGGNPEPLYVTGKDVEANTVTVAKRDDITGTEEIRIADANMIASATPDGTAVWARVRYRQPLFEATLRTAPGSYALVPKEPQKFVAAGQSAVWYSASGEMLGGGVIL